MDNTMTAKEVPELVCHLNIDKIAFSWMLHDSWQSYLYGDKVPGLILPTVDDNIYCVVFENGLSVKARLTSPPVVSEGRCEFAKGSVEFIDSSKELAHVNRQTALCTLILLLLFIGACVLTKHY